MSLSGIESVFCAICRDRDDVFLDDSVLEAFIQACLPLHFTRLMAFEEEQVEGSSCSETVADTA